MRKLFVSLVFTLLINCLSFGFDNIKNGWYINTDIGIENVYMEERIYDSVLQKTVSKSTNKNSFILDLGFGYIFKDNFILGLGLYLSTLGKEPHLLTNTKNNKFFDIYESGNYISIGYNFKEKHFIKLFATSSTIVGDEKFIKDSKYFEGTGYKIQYSYEVINHLLLSLYFKTNSFANENEWSDKIDIGSLGFKVGWLFY